MPADDVSKEGVLADDTVATLTGAGLEVTAAVSWVVAAALALSVPVE